MDAVMSNGTGKESAIRLKELGNEDFKQGHFDKAVEHYSRAIGIFSFLQGIVRDGD
jgi:hypothetical protein